jgi:glutamine---fructose-6-phosphate transaminase (isomerizing)
MCGIVGYIGDRAAYPVLINGLKRLEYRGYDSAGVVLLQNNEFNLFKKKGKVSELERISDGNDGGATPTVTLIFRTART